MFESLQPPPPSEPSAFRTVLKLITPVRLDEEQRGLAEQLDASLGPDNAPSAAKPGIFERVRRAFR